MANREEFVARSLHLLSLERAAELDESERASSRHGLSNIKFLQVASQKVGLYGRHVLVFESVHKTKRKFPVRSFPANALTNGDIVGLSSGNKPIAGQRISGVVIQSTSVQISVIFDDLPDSVDLSDHSGMIQLVKLANDVTYRRIRSALETLKLYKTGPCQHLISVLFSESQLLPPDLKYISLLEDFETYPWRNPNLNASQRKAVLSALSRPDVAIIHGPPGTGKTTTVVELILQAVEQGMKVLACAPSNIAVDNLVEKLGHANAKVVRLGHPARLQPAILQYSLDEYVASADSAGVISDVRQDIEKAYLQCRKTKVSSERRKWRSEINTLKHELKEREEKCLKHILSSAQIILCTLTGASPEGAPRFLPDDHFDIVVIDECAQALEASCWIPLLKAPRCVLAGDHCQLPPTILCQEASDEGFSLSLMERIVKQIEGPIVSTLTTQYRMNRAIMEWSSHFLYDGLLLAHESVGSKLLSGLPQVKDGKETSVALVFIDTAGCDIHELQTEDTESKGNEGEADLVFHHIKKLRNGGVNDRDIAVIAPYSLQVELIRDRIRTLHPSATVDALEVHTVDGFQGREREAVIISLTRSNDRGEYGFLKEQRRSNVAVTRARRHLCLIGDSDTVSCEPFMKGMFDTCHRIGEIWSAHEYMQDVDFEVFNFYQPKHSKCSEEIKERKKAETNGSKGLSHSSRIPTLPSHSTTLPQVSPSMKTLDLEKEEKERRSKFQESISCFIDESDSEVLAFPNTLTGNERRTIHELCEQFGLLHVSRGNGKERFIEVRKVHKESAMDQQSVDDKVEDLPVTPDNVLGSINKTCDSCGHDIPLMNWELHHIQCMKKTERREDKIGLESKLGKSDRTAQKVPKQRPRTNHCKTKEADHSDDLDALIAEVTLADSTCKYLHCAKKVNMLGILCQFCKKRFCMEHSLPEVHDCGDAVREKSRQELQREARLGSKTYGLSKAKRSQLQTKLTKRLEEKTTARQGKTSLIKKNKSTQ